MSGGMARYGSVEPPTPKAAKPVSQYIDEQGWRSYHYRIVGAVAGLTTFLASIAASLPLLLIELQKEFATTRTWLAIVAGCLLFGSIPGALAGGGLSDAFGRRSTLLAAMLVATIASFAHFFVHELWHLAVIRLVLGFSYGCIIVSKSVYMIEFLPSSTRGWCYCAAGLGWKAGTVYITLLASEMPSRWRIILALGPLGPATLTALFLLFCTAESPRWLFLQARGGEAQRVMRSIFGPEAPPFDAHPSSHGKGSCRDDCDGVAARLRLLCGKSLRRITAITCTLWLLNTGVSYAWMTWGPEILGILLRVPEIPYGLLVAVECITVGFALVGAYVLDWLGRRPTLVGACLGVAGSFALVAAISPSYVMVVAIVIALAGSWEFVWPSKALFTQEAFPTELRGTAAGLCQSFGRLGGAGFPVVGGWLFDRSLDSAVLAFSGAMVLAAGVSLLIPFETARQPIRDLV